MDAFSKLLLWGIEGLYGICGDYGVAIVLITVLIRTLLLPLNVKQRRQMQKQREIGDAVSTIKEKYAKNPQRMNEELQMLYRKEGTGMGGCLISLLQFPVMMCLYQGIRMTAAVGAATVLLPWVPSLLVRDQTFLLPTATLVMQLLPQIYPWLRFFKELRLQKPSFCMMLTLLLTGGMFAFFIPAGVGLYYFTSGLFSAAEQFVCHVVALHNLRPAAGNPSC